MQYRSTGVCNSLVQWTLLIKYFIKHRRVLKCLFKLSSNLLQVVKTDYLQLSNTTQYCHDSTRCSFSDESIWVCTGFSSLQPASDISLLLSSNMDWIVSVSSSDEHTSVTSVLKAAFVSTCTYGVLLCHTSKPHPIMQSSLSLTSPFRYVFPQLFYDFSEVLFLFLFSCVYQSIVFQVHCEQITTNK